MLTLADSVRYFLYREKTDMRKGFDGLSGLVREKLLRNPLSGEVFVFFSKRRNQVKLLLWEGDGFSMYSKRLEKGTFEMPVSENCTVEIKSDQLLFIMKGIKLDSIKKRERFAFYGR